MTFLKRIYLIFFLLCTCYSIISYAQDPKSEGKLFFSAGMGLSMTTTPSFNDYLENEIPYADKDSIKSFSAGVEFFGSIEYELAPSILLKADYSYFFKSIDYSFLYYTYDFFYSIHQPFLMAFYQFKKPTYKLMFGGGLGYNFARVLRTIDPSIEKTYTSGGVGMKGEIIFSATLSKRINSYLSAFLGGATFGSLKDENDVILKNPETGEEINPSWLGAGLRLGLTIKIN